MKFVPLLGKTLTDMFLRGGSEYPCKDFSITVEMLRRASESLWRRQVHGLHTQVSGFPQATTSQQASAHQLEGIKTMAYKVLISTIVD